MVLKQPTRPDARRGATAVEVAVVVSVLMFLLLAIFEYGRYVMLEHMLINAVREGARYALAHSQDATVVDDTKALVKQKLAGQDKQLPDLAVTVFPTNNPSAAMNTLNPD